MVAMSHEERICTLVRCLKTAWSLANVTWN